jgi:acyl-CoA synthetase (AMP-forming)/AMP-acid ligase II
MADTLLAAEPVGRLNVADRLTRFADAMPDTIAVACPGRRSDRRYRSRLGKSGALYSTTTFAELEEDATRIARGLAAWGVPPGTRLALLVKPGIEFVTLVFALLRAGMVIVLVDPGLGRRNLIRCLAAVEPEGFVAIGMAQAGRQLMRHTFRRARWNVTVGRRWFWGGMTLDQLRARGDPRVGRALPTDGKQKQMVGDAHPTTADDPAAIIFTSGSTGPPKGVLYTHRMFETQVAEIQSMYRIEPGGVDLACFPLFALFNAAMGVTTVMPEMDFSRPAAADAKKLLQAANDWQITQAFASPAVWRVVSDYCAVSGERIESLRQVFSCGAPVPASVIRNTLACVGAGAKMHTPYGATECLPLSTIEAAEVLGETAARTNEGAGVCVGRKFDSIEWRVIRIADGPILSINDAEELPPGEVGELIVRGPQVSPRYVTRLKTNGASKIRNMRAGASSPPAGADDRPVRSAIPQDDSVWHRTGDVGYLDEQGWFWYCGRKSQRVETVSGPLYTECVEAVFSTHPAVRRCALVGVGPRGMELPVLVVECAREYAGEELQREILQFAQLSPITRAIQFALVHPRLPVDVRHNAKINREYLAQWAAKQIARVSS